MKIKLLAFITALLFIGGAVIYDYQTRSETMENSTHITTPYEKGHRLPDFSFSTIDGNSFNVRDLTEERLLIHFWAGWCSTCFIEFPSLLQYTKEADGNIALIAIATDNNFAAMEKFMHKLKKEGTALAIDHVYWVWDENKRISLDLFNTVRVPETIVVDEQRQMLEKIVGPGPWDNLLATN